MKTKLIALLLLAIVLFGCLQTAEQRALDKQESELNIKTLDLEYKQLQIERVKTLLEKPCPNYIMSGQGNKQHGNKINVTLDLYQNGELYLDKFQTTVCCRNSIQCHNDDFSNYTYVPVDCSILNTEVFEMPFGYEINPKEFIWYHSGSNKQLSGELEGITIELSANKMYWELRETTQCRR